VSTQDGAGASAKPVDTPCQQPERGALPTEHPELLQRHSSLRREYDASIARINRLEGDLQALNARLSESIRILEENVHPGPRFLHQALASIGRSLRRAAIPAFRLWEAAAVARSGIFDGVFYRRAYPDVAAAGMSPLLHFLLFGRREYRNPHPLFDAYFYCERYPDVAASGMNPLAHFALYGLAENRDPASCFPIADYRSRHPDLAGENPLLHFMRCGFSRPEDCRVSVIIPRYGNADLTLRCLAALACLRDTPAHEIIVIDDCSTDEQAHPVNTIPGVVLQRQEQNRGFAASCNAGARLARGEFLVFLNNDTEVRNGWLDGLCRTFEDHEDAGLAGSKLIYPDGRLQEAGGVIWRDGSGCNYGRGEDPGRPEFNFVREVDYCSGASIMVPASLFWALGGFSEEFSPAYFEDVDLAFRVRQAGRKVYYQPLSEVVHLEGATCGRDESRGVKKHQAVNRKMVVARWQRELDARPENIAPPFPLARLSETPRVLVIDTWVPTPDQDSGSVRMRHLLEMLHRMGYAVTFAPQNMSHNGVYTEELQQLGIECLYQPHYHDLHHVLAERAEEFSFFWIARYENLREIYDHLRHRAPAARLVLDTVDLHFLRLERQAALSGCIGDRLLAKQARRDELGLAAACDAVVIVSSVEQELVSRLLPPQKVHLVSNVHAIPVVRQGFNGRRNALFVGGFNHTPNEDAVRWLTEEIWPRVVQRRPEAHVFIIGSNAPEWIRRLRSPGVEVIGHVPDLAAWYDRVALSVAPLRYGAGVKGKIGESMAHGVPVVATTIGAEGMHAIDGRNMMIADTATAFADAIVRVMEDAGLWRTLSTEALETIQRSFSVGAAQHNLERLFHYLESPSIGIGS
jgi:O-antigen biosynthesis protein